MVAKPLKNSRYSCFLAFTLLIVCAQAADDKQTAKPATPDPTVAIEPRIKPAPGTPDPERASLNTRPASIRIDKTLVQINVTVTDPLNRFVTGLDKDYFKLFEEKVEQEISQFSS